VLRNGRASVDRANRHSDLLREVEKSNFDLLVKVDDLERKREDDGIAIGHLTRRIENEIAARKKAETHASTAIDELAKSGNAPATAERLRNDLERLRALAGKVQEVPDHPDADRDGS
jgi:hypothetical protein